MPDLHGFPAKFKLDDPAAEVRGAGAFGSPKELRATETFIGQCPTVKIVIEGVELQGLLDTGSQVTLIQESLFNEHFSQAKLEKTPTAFKLRAANGLEIPYTTYAVLDMEIEGFKVPGRGVVVVKDDHCTHPLIIGMNVVTACWNVFKWPEKTAPVPQQLTNQQAWRTAFATCSRIEASTVEDGMVGYVRLAVRRKIKVPPRSEIMVWGRAQTGPQGTDYCALVEALPETPDVGVARTLVMVRPGRVPVTHTPILFL